MKSYTGLESDYISLFEYQQEKTALHLYAHLYSNDKSQPMPVYQRLKALYREFDIELATDRVTEHPDHLSVQLEFFAYLHRLLSQDNDDYAVKKITGAINGFCIELEWTKNWLSLFEAESTHVFYLPLAQLLLLMLDETCSNTEA